LREFAPGFLFSEVINVFDEFSQPTKNIRSHQDVLRTRLRIFELDRRAACIIDGLFLLCRDNRHVVFLTRFHVAVAEKQRWYGLAFQGFRL
jgi:hypothetical protein